MRNSNLTYVAIWLAVLSVFLLGQGCPTPSDVTDTFELTLEILGEGSVTLAPPGITYDQDDSPASETYDSGATVTLTATPDDGWAFYNWTGNLSGNDNPATLTMDDDKDVTALFMPEELVTLLDEIEPPPDNEPLTQGTWTGYIAAEYQMEAEGSGECRTDNNEGTFTYEHKESESRKAAVSVGPYSDIFVTSPREMGGKLVVSMDNSYHNVTRDDYEDCCVDPPCANQVSPGDVFDYLTTQTGGDTITFDQEIMGISTEVLLSIWPAGMEEDNMDGWEFVQETLTWVRPYEDTQIPVVISVEITAADDKEVPVTEASDDSYTDACNGTTETNTPSSEAGTISLSMSYTIEGTLIKRSNGQHEIIGMDETNWTEESGLFPCGSHYPREYRDHCTVHLIRTP